jgi:hypothetical protein
MSSTSYFGCEECLSRPAALLVALGLWVAGLAMVGAVALRMHHGSTALETSEMSTTSETSVEGAPTALDTSSDPTASAGVLVMPQDTVLAHPVPTAGVTLKQKP